MRILIINQWFQPEPALKGLPLAQELVKLGHEVEVLTGFPNYPGGKVYDGYKIRLLQKEIIDGIPVIRIPLYPSHNDSGFQRFLNYMSFAIMAAIIGPWVVKRADVAYVYHPPATTQFGAIIIHLFRRIPLVYDIQDLWPESLQASGMFTSKIGLWFVGQVCKIFYKFAKKIVVLSPGYKEEISQRGVSPDKIEVIYNWCDGSASNCSVQDPSLAEKLGLSGRFNIMFAGNLGKGQSLSYVLDAAKIVQTQNSNIQFVFIGGGLERESLEQKAKEQNINNVLFLDRRPVSEIGAIMNIADVLLVHLKDNELYTKTIPSKTQAYLAIGKPILMGVRGNAADLVTRAKAGLLCQPENPNSIAETSLRLSSMPKEELIQMGKNGRQFYEQELSLEIGVRRFEKIFQSIATCKR